MRAVGNKWLSIPQTQAIQLPTIDPRLEELNAVARSTECLRHFFLSIEFWISPDGRLRQWIRLNLCLSAFLLIPAVLLIPVISFVLREVDGWLSVLLSIVLKLIVLGILIFMVRTAIKHFPSSSKGSSRRRK